MISPADLLEIGRFLKTHGIHGEIAFNCFYDLDLTELRCIVIDIDGIPVPFFVETVREKGPETLIVKLADIDNEKQAALLCHKAAYALKTDVDIMPDEPDADEGFSAYDFEGYTIIDDTTGRIIGIVDYIDDSTQNWLFMVEPPQNPDPKARIAIPVADEFITSIDTDNRTLGVTLPAGLLEL